MVGEKGVCAGSVNYDDAFNDVTPLEGGRTFDSYTRGLSTQLSWQADRYHGNAVSQQINFIELLANSLDLSL